MKNLFRRTAQCFKQTQFIPTHQVNKIFLMEHRRTDFMLNLLILLFLESFVGVAKFSPFC